MDYTEMLPPLPGESLIDGTRYAFRFDAAAMRTYSLAAIAAAAPAIRAAERERAAVLIQDYPHWIGEKAKSEIAAAIRALPDEV